METKRDNKTLRGRLTFSNVVAMIALFAALGGSAWAVSKAPRNSVYSSSIKDGQVKTRDVKRHAVKNRLIKPDTLKSSRIKDGHVRAADLGEIEVRSDTIPVVDGSQNNTTVNCEPDDVVLGGGASWDSLNTGVRLQQSYRSGDGWNAAGANDSGAQRELTVYVYCLRA